MSFVAGAPISMSAMPQDFPPVDLEVRDDCDAYCGYLKTSHQLLKSQVLRYESQQNGRDDLRHREVY